MRRRGPAEQRLWLGSGRYLGCGGSGHADADAHCDSDSDRHANCHRHRNSNSNANRYGATNAHAQIGANGKAASHTYPAALDFPVPKISSDR